MERLADEPTGALTHTYMETLEKETGMDAERKYQSKSQ